MNGIVRFLASSGFLLLPSLATASAQVSLHSERLEITHDKPYVMVMVNGRGPFRFVIDTGTGGPAIVTPELADTLGLPVTGQARLTDPSGQGERREQIVQIDSLVVAGVEFTGIKAIRHALGGEDGTCQGLLGFPLFRDYLLTLDYPNRTITLASGSLRPDGVHSVLPFRMPEGVPIVLLRIGDTAVEAQFDSGGTGLSLPEPLVGRLKLSSGPVPYGNGQSLATRYQVKAARLADDVHLGRYSFPHAVVEVNPAFPLANLGAQAIGNFSVTFDQRNQLLAVYSARQSFHLDLAPTEVRMKNAPPAKPVDQALVPVG
ncbi:MAG TPA: retropepsin-like aspartic protease [Terracidiphilus sp.]|nr:retropepsin-like aspartic protease [Terracidiphilus sp.]